LDLFQQRRFVVRGFFALHMANDELEIGMVARYFLGQRVMTLDDQRTALRNKYYDAMKKVLPTVTGAIFPFGRPDSDVD
jgi:hypothetical protein